MTTNEAAERLWLRVNQPDVPMEIAPMLRDALRLAALEQETQWRAAERRAMVERIRERFASLLFDHEYLEHAMHILDEEAAR